MNDRYEFNLIQFYVQMSNLQPQFHILEIDFGLVVVCFKNGKDGARIRQSDHKFALT